MYLSWKEEKMETINIKFDEKQLEEVVKKLLKSLKTKVGKKRLSNERI